MFWTDLTHYSSISKYLILGQPKGRHVVIVDDLVQTGGTLIECARVSGSIENYTIQFSTISINLLNTVYYYNDSSLKYLKYIIHKLYKNRFQALYAAGATRISAYVTHAVFPRDSWKKFTEPGVDFSNFWITDSLPHAPMLAQYPPFSLLSLADSISDVLLGYDLIAQDG